MVEVRWELRTCLTSTQDEASPAHGAFIHLHSLLVETFTADLALRIRSKEVDQSLDQVDLLLALLWTIRRLIRNQVSIASSVLLSFERSEDLFVDAWLAHHLSEHLQAIYCLYFLNLLSVLAKA